jgi:hypothetical protein
MAAIPSMKQLSSITDGRIFPRGDPSVRFYDPVKHSIKNAMQSQFIIVPVKVGQKRVAFNRNLKHDNNKLTRMKSCSNLFLIAQKSV